MIFAQLSEIKNVNPNLKRIAVVEAIKNDIHLHISSLLIYFLNKNSKEVSQCEFEYYKLRNGMLLQMFYEFQLNLNSATHLKTENKISSQDSKYCIIFGGTGCIGLTFVSVIQKLYANINIIFVSRHATSKSKDLKTLLPSADFFDVDISDPLQIDLFFHQVKKIKKCEFFVFCAGIPPSSEPFDNKEYNVFQAKLYGTLNILNTLKKINLQVNSFIFNSSLTAINGLPGARNYAAANMFLDSMVKSSKKLLNYSYNIVSIQWPAWSQSKMFRNSKLFENKFITNNAIDNQTAATIIEKIIYENLNGVIAIAKTNPLKIRNLLQIKKNINDDDQKIIEQINRDKNLDLRTILMKLWLQCLPKTKFSNEITNLEDFFALGGNSLNGIQLVWRIEKALKIPSFKISIDWLFNYPKFENFYEKIKAEVMLFNSKQSNSLNDIPMINKETNIPLSLPQEQMWILWNLIKENNTQSLLYNIVFEIILNGSDLCIKTIALSLRKLFAEQTALRTIFVKTNNSLYPSQEVFFIIKFMIS